MVFPQYLAPFLIMLTQEYLNSYFYYNNGMLFWKKTTKGRIKANHRAGSLCKTHKYRFVGALGKIWSEHRVIYIMKKGAIPEGYQIDHIDGNRSNNKIENLRLATDLQNRHNIKKKKNSKHKYKGISFSNRLKNSWTAEISHNGIRTRLGTFKTPEEAHEAYKKAAILYHGEFANWD